MYDGQRKGQHGNELNDKLFGKIFFRIYSYKCDLNSLEARHSTSTTMFDLSFIAL